VEAASLWAGTVDPLAEDATVEASSLWTGTLDRPVYIKLKVEAASLGAGMLCTVCKVVMVGMVGMVCMVDMVRMVGMVGTVCMVGMVCTIGVVGMAGTIGTVAEPDACTEVAWLTAGAVCDPAGIETRVEVSWP